VNPPRRRLALASSLLCLLATAGISRAAEVTTLIAKSPDVRSQAVLVIDRATSAVIYSRHAEQAAPIASITKLMTALVVLDGGQPLDEEVAITTVDRTRTQNLPSRLAVGTKLTRRELLRLALMSSENRAAQALATSYTGGEPAFLKAMNAKAAELGMVHSKFEDPTGLSDHNVASPNDLVRLVTAANQNALVREYSTAQAHSVRVGRQQVEFRNTNPLVRDPTWQVSVQKTGHIAAAGQCLVLQALVDGRDVVIVLLNSFGKYTRVADARRIRKWMGPAQAVVAAATTPAT
jgi:D-alanyl-D-alanine endopeptidase (penicillin-binding protein 7)